MIQIKSSLLHESVTTRRCNASDTGDVCGISLFRHTCGGMECSKTRFAIEIVLQCTMPSPRVQGNTTRATNARSMLQDVMNTPCPVGKKAIRAHKATTAKNTIVTVVLQPSEHGFLQLPISSSSASSMSYSHMDQRSLAVVEVAQHRSCLLRSLDQPSSYKHLPTELKIISNDHKQ
ncbi:hypothetical protein SEVIR_6G036751v4 [Setaria viridis]